LIKNRVRNIFNKLKKPTDIIIIKNSDYPYIDNNFFYFTGIKNGLFEGSILILYPDGNMDIVMSTLEVESAKKSIANLLVYKNRKEYNEIMKTSIAPFKNIGLNYLGISLLDFFKFQELFPKSNFYDISNELQKVRLVKDRYELKNIKKACVIADQIVEKIPELLNEGVYEYEIAAEIDYSMQKLGAEKPAFETICSFDVNTAEPHYSHGNTKLKKGNFALFDFGASVNRYNSDITRTFVYKNPSEKQKDIYETVLKAQKVGLENIKPNKKACDIHEAVNTCIDKTKYKGRFIHSTGHSIGLSVHDGGRLSPDSNIILKENMVFTVEPGIYIPKYGGVRIEDDVLVTKDGYELLTKTPKTFLEL